MKTVWVSQTNYETIICEDINPESVTFGRFILLVCDIAIASFDSMHKAYWYFVKEFADYQPYDSI